MWFLFSRISPQHQLLPVWTRGLHKPAPTSRVDSYHVSASLLCPEGSSSINPAVKRRRRTLNTSSVQHKPVVREGVQTHERSAQSKAWRNETPELQRSNERRGHDSRVSSELRRLSLEDFPAEKKQQQQKMVVGQRSALDSRAHNHEIVFGIAPCVLALTQGRRKALKLFVKDGEASQRESVLKVCEEAHRREVPVHRVSKRDLDKMSSGRVHQGVCLQASPLGYLTEDRDAAPSGGLSGRTPLWLVLERIQDPMNMGAILRSAYFLGVDRVVSSLRHSCPLSPVVSKASSGAMEVIWVYGYENLEDMVKGKVARGWQVVGTVGADEAQGVPVTQCSDFQMSKPTVLLMGSEGEGLSRQLLSLCHTLLTVPAGRELFPGIESLNVSVATGILLHSLLSSRRSPR